MLFLVISEMIFNKFSSYLILFLNKLIKIKFIV